MGELLTQRRQLALETEVTPGTAVALDATDVKPEVFNLTVAHDIPLFERNPHRTSIDPQSAIVGTKAVTFSFETDFKGSGSISTAPDWGEMIQACGYSETALDSLSIGAITGGPFLHGEEVTGDGGAVPVGHVYKETATGTSTMYIITDSGAWDGTSETVTGTTSGATATQTGGDTTGVGFIYLPISSSIPALSMGSYEDGFAKLGTGVRGTFVLSHTVGEPVRMQWTFTGAQTSNANAALWTGTSYNTDVPPSFVNAALDLGGFAPFFTTMEISLNNTLAIRGNANSASGLIAAQITARNPTGTMDAEAELTGATDFYADRDAVTSRYFDYTIGSGAGKVLSVIGPNTQIRAITDEDRDGIALMSLELGFFGTSTTTDEALALMMV